MSKTISNNKNIKKTNWKNRKRRGKLLVGEKSTFLSFVHIYTQSVFPYRSLQFINGSFSLYTHISIALC